MPTGTASAPVAIKAADTPAAPVENETEKVPPAEDASASVTVEDEFDAFFEDEAGETGSGETDPFADFGNDSFAETPADEDLFKQEDSIADPLEFWNRPVLVFNNKVYFWVLKPAATGYKKITPTCFRQGVKNIFQNIQTPIRLVNSALQGKFFNSFEELQRFVMNTTIGVGGIFNISDHFFDMQPSDEDFGQTLGHYGLGNGFYIVWPMMGPSTLRDTTGMITDGFMNPLNYVEPWELSAGISIFETVNGLSFRLGQYKSMIDSAIDPYIMVRDAYVTFRKNKVAK